MGKVSAILPVLKGSVMQSQPQPVVIVQSRIQSVMQQVYLWMTAGLLLTGAISSMLASNEVLLGMVLNPIVFIGLFVVELGLVLAISAFINKMSPALATGLFILYAALNGITLTPIFITYTSASIATAFFTTAGMFAALTLYGSVTKRDLSGMGRFLLMALFGLCIATIVNIFLRNGIMDLVISIFGVLIFAGLTAYDTQRLNQIASQAMSEDDIGRFSIMGALTLYLDFINLFLYLLRLFGKRND
jgi:FtsH-binding integral membrane protein